MVHFKWIASLLWMPFLWRFGLPLLRPTQIEWNPSPIPQTNIPLWENSEEVNQAILDFLRS